MPALLRYLALLFLLVPCLVAAAEVKQSRNSETELFSWQVEDRGFSLELVQLHTDFVRAVYGARGFPPALIDGIAEYCVFGTIAINTSDAQLSYRVADWRYVTPDGEQHPLKTKTQWTTEWMKMGVPYNWSILPDDQTFEVGDWSQGFTTVRLPRESVFDLVYSWTVEGKTHVSRIEELRCAPEHLPER
ncbi:MAG: hypothetical protein QNJ87_08855 [Gammaproteobacteria bacterium]|nr:hypothetical protein [Gammaproteobacteria bacterium]MDJ0891724.1 hypothetical protein [Gammaproteobacteria bacterium]